jgi:hypothetical protein
LALKYSKYFLAVDIHQKENETQKGTDRPVAIWNCYEEKTEKRKMK